MPNRIIKESIKTSEQIDALDWFQEAMWSRLIVTVDDYGCFEAKPKLLKNVLFPLKDNVTEEMVCKALKAFEDNGLILLYEHGGKEYLCMKTWAEHQRIRTKTKKFPEPPGGYPQPKSASDYQSINGGNPQSVDSNLRQVAADCGRLRQTATNRGNVRPESNPIQSKEKEKNTSPEPLIDEREAIEMSEIHEEIFSEMKKAGFQMNQGLMEAAVDLFATYGYEKIINAIRECTGASGNKLRYLKKVLENYGKPRPGRAETDDPDNDVKKAWEQAKKLGGDAHG